MRWLLALLLLVASACAAETDFQDPRPGVLPSRGHDVPAAYMQTLLATQHEWVAANMPFPEECVTMATRMTLYFDEWDEMVAACGRVPGSAPVDYDSGVEGLEQDDRVIACINSSDRYLVHFDNGITEGKKHLTFVHEVLHGLQYCSQRGKDGTHLDTYVWNTIMPRARFQVLCGGRARFGEAELDEVNCYTP